MLWFDFCVGGNKPAHMKIIFTFQFIFIFATCFSQNRKSVLNQIQDYKDSVVWTATYPSSPDGLESMINNYFLADGWEYYSDDSLLRKRYAVYTRREEVCSIKEVCLNRRSQFTYRSGQALLRVTVFDIKDGADFSLNRSCMPRVNLDELQLRRHLYIHYFGDQIDFPVSLEEKIAQYNTRQKSERRLLVSATHY